MKNIVLNQSEGKSIAEIKAQYDEELEMNTSSSMVSLKAVGMLLRITDALVAIVAALFCYGFYLWDYANIEPEIYVMVTIVAVFLQKNYISFLENLSAG